VGGHQGGCREREKNSATRDIQKRFFKRGLKGAKEVVLWRGLIQTDSGRRGPRRPERKLSRVAHRWKGGARHVSRCELRHPGEGKYQLQKQDRGGWRDKKSLPFRLCTGHPGRLVSTKIAFWAGVEIWRQSGGTNIGKSAH